MIKKFSKLCEHKHTLLFAAGAATALAGYAFIKSDTAKEIGTNAMAKVMSAQKKAEEEFQNMKDDAEDICHDADAVNKEKVYIENPDEVKDKK